MNSANKGKERAYPVPFPRRSSTAAKIGRLVPINAPSSALSSGFSFVSRIPVSTARTSSVSSSQSAFTSPRFSVGNPPSFFPLRSVDRDASSASEDSEEYESDKDLCAGEVNDDEDDECEIERDERDVPPSLDLLASAAAASSPLMKPVVVEENSSFSSRSPSPFVVVASQTAVEIIEVDSDSDDDEVTPVVDDAEEAASIPLPLSPVSAPQALPILDVDRAQNDEDEDAAEADDGPLMANVF
jgi:hypothetical protein